MMEIDRAVLQNIMLVVPFNEWSPLFETERGRDQFIRWCAHDASAARLVHEALAEAPVFELDDQDNAFILSVDYADAEALLHTLVSAYEDHRLQRLFDDF